MSLRLRITIIVTALLLAVLLGSGLLVANVEGREADRDVEKRLRHLVHTSAPPLDADWVFEAVHPPHRGPGGQPPFDEPAQRPPEPVTLRLDDESDGAHVEILYFFLDPRRGVTEPVLCAHVYTGEAEIEPSSGTKDRAVVRGRVPIDVTTVNGREFVVLAEPVERQIDPSDRPFRRGPGPDRQGPRRVLRLNAVAFLEREPALGALRSRLRMLILTGLGAVILGAGLAFLLAGQMLRPVRSAAEAAESIKRPEQRLPVPAREDELGRLVTVLNGMLGRLEAGAERERTFLATASHELRRPLTALTGELELAQRGERSHEDLVAAIDRSHGDAMAMGRLVDDLLHRARTRAGALRLIPTDVDLVDVIAESVARSRRVLANETPIQLKEIPPVTVRGDKDMLGRVFENLLVNAGTHGGGEVGVAVSGEMLEKEIRIHVEDDGAGIAPEEIPHIFEPFGRGDRVRSAPGAGLGLAIAQDLVRAHGGVIAVTSPLRRDGDVARGTRFTVRLPRRRRRT